MEFIKKLKLLIDIPKMLIYSSKIEKLINKRKFDEAYDDLEKLDILYNKNIYLTRYIYRAYLNFLTGKYNEIFCWTSLVDDRLIKDDFETLYKKKFIYSLEYLELLLNNDKKANNIVKKIDGLFFNYFNVELYMRERFPLFTQKRLKEIFYESEYYKGFPKEKLDKIITCFPTEASGEIKKYKGK